MLVIIKSFNETPYANTQFANDPSFLFDDGARISIVFIKNFFTDGQDFAFIVAGRPNVTAFVHGTFGMQAYNGPLIATPIMSRRQEFLDRFQIVKGSGGKVQKSSSQLERVKWRYLFETARLAWSKLKVHPLKLGMVRTKRAKLLSRETQVGQTLNAD
jgi:hypothetical protein